MLFFSLFLSLIFLCLFTSHCTEERQQIAKLSYLLLSLASLCLYIFSLTLFEYELILVFHADNNCAPHMQLATVRNAFVAQTETVSRFAFVNGSVSFSFSVSVSFSFSFDSQRTASLCFVGFVLVFRSLRRFGRLCCRRLQHTHTHTHTHAFAASRKNQFSCLTRSWQRCQAVDSVSACTCRHRLNSRLTFVYVPPRRRWSQAAVKP